MKMARVFVPLLLAGGLAFAQEELTAYSASEIDNLLRSFKQTYNKSKVPQEDAIAVLEDLKKAYRYLAAKEGATKEDQKLNRKIVNMVAKGLKARKRSLVTLECARVLGELGDEAGARPLLRWMDGEVLSEKSPPAQLVEYGFKSMAWIGGDDKATLDLLRNYATGRHVDSAVASHALNGVIEWRFLKGKDRKVFLEKIIGYIGGLHANAKGGDAKKRGVYEQRYNTVKDKGFEAITELAATGKKFGDPVVAMEWWKDNKKRRKWDDYVGPRFRKAKPKKEEKGEEGGDAAG